MGFVKTMTVMAFSSRSSWHQDGILHRRHQSVWPYSPLPASLRSAGKGRQGLSGCASKFLPDGSTYGSKHDKDINYKKAMIDKFIDKYADDTVIKSDTVDGTCLWVVASKKLLKKK